jgi:hypothetical protein
VSLVGFGFVGFFGQVVWDFVWVSGGLVELGCFWGSFEFLLGASTVFWVSCGFGYCGCVGLWGFYWILFVG